MKAAHEANGARHAIQKAVQTNASKMTRLATDITQWLASPLHKGRTWF